MNPHDFLAEFDELPEVAVTLHHPELLGDRTVTFTVKTLTGKEADAFGRAQVSEERATESVALFTGLEPEEVQRLPAAWVAELYSQGLDLNRFSDPEDDDPGNSTGALGDVSPSA